MQLPALTDRRISRADALFFSAPRGRPYAVYCGLIGILMAGYFVLGMRLIETTNAELNRSDQDANLNLASQARNDWYPHRTAVVQPLWPWIASRFYHPNPETFFVRGKWVNLVLSGIFAGILSLAAGRLLPLVPALIFSSVAIFGVWLQRAHYFQPEPVLFGWFAATFFLMAWSLVKTRWWIFALTGVTTGLLMLAKASAGPLLVVFLIASGIRAGFWILIRSSRGSVWNPWRHCAGILVMAVLAACITAPMFSFNLQKHRDAFHTLPKYYAWLESWPDEAIPMTPILDDPDRLEALPPSEVPSASNYLARFGWAHTLERLTAGTLKTFHEFALPPGRMDRTVTPKIGMNSGGEPRLLSHIMPARGLYVLAACGLALLMGLLCAANPEARKAISPDMLSVAAFVTGVFLIYLLGYGWYERIGRGERFMLLVVVPVLASALWMAARLARVQTWHGGRVAYAGILVVILCHILFQFVITCLHPHFKAVT